MGRKLQREALERTYGNTGSVRAEDLPYDAVDDLKTSLDERTPPVITSLDGGKLSQAYYVSPPAYGDSSEGSVTISTETQINSYTDLVADVNLGSNTITVRDVSPAGETPFAQGDQVCIVQTQCFRDAAKRFKYEFLTIDSVDGGLNTITFTSALLNSYDSDAGGNAADQSKAQVIRVPQYNVLTLDANIIPKPWDGYCGGYLIYRAKSVAGAGLHDVRQSGFRAFTCVNGDGIFPWSYHCEGPLGKAKNDTVDIGAVDENVCSLYQPANSSFVQGGTLGFNGFNVAPSGGDVHYMSSGYTVGGTAFASGDFAAQLPLTLGLMVAVETTIQTTSVSQMPLNQSPGTIMCFVENFSLYSGTMQVNGLRADPGGFGEGEVPGGFAIVYAPTAFPLASIDVTPSNVAANDGLKATEVPASEATKGFQHGPKVTTDPALAAGNDLIPKSAVETLIAASNPGYSTTFVDGDLAAGVLTVAHNLGQQVVTVAVADNNGNAVSAPINYVNTTTLTIDLSVLGTITGTWTVACGIGGRDIASLMRASVVDATGGDYNVEAAEAGYLIEMGDGVAGRTLNIRDYATHPVTQNDMWLVSREGTEPVTIQAAAGVELNGVLGGSVTISDQFGEVALRAKDPVNDIWRVTGNYTQV